MALLGNGSVILKSPARFLSGQIAQERANWNRSGSERAAFSNSKWSKKSAKPYGYSPPGAWVLPITTGGISSVNQTTATFTVGVVLGTPAVRSVAMTMAATCSCTMSANAIISCAIVPFTTLSPENLAVAVWSASLPGSYISGQAGKIVPSIQTNTNLIPGLF